MKIALFKPSSILDRIICFFSRGKYSHAAIILDDGSVIEAKPFHGVRKVKSIYDVLDSKESVEVFAVDITTEQTEMVERFLHEQVGKKYDYWMVFGFVIYTDEESRKSRNKWFCSELLFMAFLKAGVELLCRIDPWKVSPTMLSYSPIAKLEYSIQK